MQLVSSIQYPVAKHEQQESGRIRLDTRVPTQRTQFAAVAAWTELFGAIQATRPESQCATHTQNPARLLGFAKGINRLHRPREAAGQSKCLWGRRVSPHWASARPRTQQAPSSATATGANAPTGPFANTVVCTGCTAPLALASCSSCTDGPSVPAVRSWIHNVKHVPPPGYSPAPIP
mgnify:CR=1 FL=1